MNIQEIISRINENAPLLANGTISEIDRDVLLDDLRRLYLLAKGSTEPVQKVTIIAPPAAVVETLVVAPVIIKEEVAAPVIEKAPVVEELPVIIQKEEPIQEIIVPKEEPKVVAAPVDKEPLPVIEFVKEEVVKTKASSLNEVFAGEERSLNDRLSGDKRTALNDNIGRKDLKGMIDFNKQYILTNELFKGDSQAFQTAIGRINDAPTIEDAFEYIKTDLLPKYQWSADMQSARLFDKLVRQKFGLS